MKPVGLACRLACVALPLLAGCQTGNRSTGNDTEAALDPPAHAAPHRPATEALANVAIENVQPETMGEADLASLGDAAACLFRFGRDAWPAFAYAAQGGPGFIKLNGALVALPRVHEGQFADGGLRVSLMPVGSAGTRAAMREAKLIVRLPQASQELGFRGYAECQRQGR